MPREAAPDMVIPASRGGEVVTLPGATHARAHRVRGHDRRARRNGASRPRPRASPLAAELLFGPNGTFITAFGTGGTAPGQFEAPSGVVAGPAGLVYVADTDNNRIQKFVCP